MHYLAWVVANRSEDIKSIMAPYDENNESEHKFRDMRQEIEADYEKITDKIRLSSGDLKYAHDEMFRIPETFGTSFGGDHPPMVSNTHDYRLVCGAKIVSVSHKEMYPTLDSFNEEYWGHEKGEFGYRRNPHGYWDWFVIGGRYDLNRDGERDPEQRMPLDDHAGRVYQNHPIDNCFQKSTRPEQRPYSFVTGEGFRSRSVWNDKEFIDTPDWDKKIDAWVNQLEEDQNIFIVDYHS